MKRHFLLIDSLDKLVIKKDSSLLLALTLQERGVETYILFQDDLYMAGNWPYLYNVKKFKGTFSKETFYINDFNITENTQVTLSSSDIFHMRMDPPFDSRYMRSLWMLNHLENQGVTVINSPSSIMKYNEKITAFENPIGKLSTFIGFSNTKFRDFLNELLNKTPAVKNIILKPLDFYQGIGVQKFSLDQESIDDIVSNFSKKINSNEGPLVCQPFAEKVLEGETRISYFNGESLGAIIKTPQDGKFLANVAQGASFKPYEPKEKVMKATKNLALELAKVGVPWVAIDVIDEYITEVNVTCPGLLVEHCHAFKTNFASIIADSLT